MEKLRNQQDNQRKSQSIRGLFDDGIINDGILHIYFPWLPASGDAGEWRQVPAICRFMHILTKLSPGSFTPNQCEEPVATTGSLLGLIVLPASGQTK